MSKENNLTDFLTDVADAIRYSASTSVPINPQNFSDEIKKLKFGTNAVSLTSENTISGDDLNNIQEKQRYLLEAINNTIIDGETVYKINQQVNTANTLYLDTVFYTQEGDQNGYYYVLNGVDQYLSKVIL